MASRHSAFKDVMNELRGKIKEHASSKLNREYDDEGYEDESSEHEESESDEDEAEEHEPPQGPDLCPRCANKMNAEHKFCANCGSKR